MERARSTRLVSAAFAAALLIGAAGCGDDGDEPSIPQSGERETTTTEATTTTAEVTTTAGAGDQAPEGSDASTTTVAGGEQAPEGETTP